MATMPGTFLWLPWSLTPKQFNGELNASRRFPNF
jgi:hypothetical protein